MPPAEEIVVIIVGLAVLTFVGPVLVAVGSAIGVKLYRRLTKKE